MAEAALPPGPRLPRWLQTLGFILAPVPWIEANRRRYGDVVTFRSLFDPGLRDGVRLRAGQAGVPRLARAAARRRGQRRAGPGGGRAVGAAARRRRAHAPAQAAVAVVPRRADARLRARDARGGRPRDRLVSGGRAVRAAAAHPAAHPGDHHARRVRRGRRPAAGRADAAGAHDGRPRGLAAGACCCSCSPGGRRGAGAGEQFEARASRRGRADLRGDRARRAEPDLGGARGRAVDAAAGPRRGRPADDRRRVARRAGHAARGRPRDHRHRAGVGVRAAAAKSARARSG